MQVDVHIALLLSTLLHHQNYTLTDLLRNHWASKIVNDTHYTDLLLWQVHYDKNDVRNTHLFNVERFDDVIATYMRERRIPGASVAVGRDGQFLIRKGTFAVCK